MDRRPRPDARAQRRAPAVNPGQRTSLVLLRLSVASNDGDWILRENQEALDHVLGFLAARSCTSNRASTRGACARCDPTRRGASRSRSASYFVSVPPVDARPQRYSLARLGACEAGASFDGLDGEGALEVMLPDIR